jgi:hypothetical protein
MRVGNRISFVWQGSGSLVERLAAPWSHLLLRLAQHQRPIEAIFSCSGVAGVRIRSKMHDIGVRKEIGVLEFDDAPVEPVECVDQLVLPASFLKGNLGASKLVATDNGITAESGLALRTDSGNEVIVVAGDYPFTLAVLVDGSCIDQFQPEYPMQSYRELPFAQ